MTHSTKETIDLHLEGFSSIERAIVYSRVYDETHRRRGGAPWFPQIGGIGHTVELVVGWRGHAGRRDLIREVLRELRQSVGFDLNEHKEE